jgi:hypothetical protein
VHKERQAVLAQSSSMCCAPAAARDVNYIAHPVSFCHESHKYC